MLFSITVYSQKGNTAEVNEEPQVYDRVEEMPEYPGGRLQLNDDIEGALVYPAEAKGLNIVGKVFVQFVVDSEGYVVDAKVIRSIHPILDEEALNAVKALRQWKPGFHNGKAVNVRQVVPVNFQ